MVLSLTLVSFTFHRSVNGSKRLYIFDINILKVNQRQIDAAGHRTSYYASEDAKNDVRLCNNLPFGNYNIYYDDCYFNLRLL